jgi:phasin family protein
MSTKTKTAKDFAETVVPFGAEAAQKGYQKAVEMTKEHVEKAQSAFTKGYGEINAMSKDTMDAVIRSGTIAAKGYETLNKEWMQFAQTSVDQTVGHVKALMQVKSFKEAIDLQNDFAKARFDAIVAESTKFSDLSVKTANEAIQPIQAQINTAVEKLLTPLAA